MKKLLLFLAMLGVLLYAMPTQAQEAPKQTVKQRILQIRLAKLKAKNATSSTWSVNTGTVACNTIPIVTTFTGTNKELYEKARDHLFNIEKSLYKLQIDDKCQQKYNEYKKLYIEKRDDIIEVRDSNYKIYMTDYINKLRSELESSKYQYKECLKRNSNLPSVDREYCWNDPEITLGVIIDNFDTRKAVNHR